MSVLYGFLGGSDGSLPRAGVTIGPNGSLYGTTTYGGSSSGCLYGPSCGTVFNLRPPMTLCRAISCPWVETVLYRFTGGSDGGNPQFGDLLFDKAGSIYGTAQFEGNMACQGGCGIVFRLTPSGGSWTQSVIYSFSGADGANPQGGLTPDSAGNLYGTTYGGGSHGHGTVFELSPSGSGWT